MKDGIYKLLLNDFISLYKVNNNELFKLERKGKTYVWVPTLMEDSRKDKLQSLSEEALCGALLDSKKEHFNHINSYWYNLKFD